MNYFLLWAILQPFELGFNPFHVCGEDDFQYTTRYNNAFNVDYDWVQENAKPVAQVGGCSATLIDKNIILTARHCQIKEKERVKFNYLFDGVSKDTLVEEVLESDRKLDYAILRIQYTPETILVRKLTDTIPSLDEEVYLMSHPARKRQMISAGVVRFSDEFRIGYEADSLGGSSGAGVVDHSGELFAVHQFGSCFSDGRGYGYNGGTLIKKIAEKSYTIRRLLKKSLDI